MYIYIHIHQGKGTSRLARFELGMGSLILLVPGHTKCGDAIHSYTVSLRGLSIQDVPCKHDFFFFTSTCIYLYILGRVILFDVI